MVDADALKRYIDGLTLSARGANVLICLCAVILSKLENLSIGK